MWRNNQRQTPKPVSEGPLCAFFSKQARQLKLLKLADNSYSSCKANLFAALINQAITDAPNGHLPPCKLTSGSLCAANAAAAMKRCPGRQGPQVLAAFTMEWLQILH